MYKRQVANLTTIQTLLGRNDVVITDKLSHASIIDGCLLCNATFQRFRHNDMDDLRRLLEAGKNRYDGKPVSYTHLSHRPGNLACPNMALHHSTRAQFSDLLPAMCEPSIRKYLDTCGTYRVVFALEPLGRDQYGLP